MRPNVGAEPTAEAGADRPRRDDDSDGPERPVGACWSGSARVMGWASRVSLNESWLARVQDAADGLSQSRVVKVLWLTLSRAYPFD